MTRKKWLEPSDPGLFGGTPKYNEESSDLGITNNGYYRLLSEL